jgi:hypothetical protein
MGDGGRIVPSDQPSGSIVGKSEDVPRIIAKLSLIRHLLFPSKVAKLPSCKDARFLISR